jgi:hypothetical protein
MLLLLALQKCQQKTCELFSNSLKLGISILWAVKWERGSDGGRAFFPALVD